MSTPRRGDESSEGASSLSEWLPDTLAVVGRRLEGRRCLIALSGGPDSAVLAWLADRYASSARAVHVHHGWPGSDTMAEAAAAVAQAVGIRLEVVRVSVAEGPSPEAQAREARHRALVGAARPGEVIVLGHTRNDQAETVLFNVARGAGPRGVAGIQEETSLLFRPLLDVERGDIEAAVESLSLPAVHDPANADPNLTRNRIRAALPVLEQAVGTAVVAGLSRSGHLAGQQEALLRDLAGTVPLVRRGDTVQIPRAVLASLATAVRRHVLLSALRQVRPYGGTASELERIEALGPGQTTELAGGFLATMTRAMLVLGPRPGPPPPAHRWESEQRRVTWGSWVFSVRIAAGPALPFPLGRRAAVFDATVLDRGPLVIRAVQPGDQIAIAGGHKDVTDALGEGLIARPARPSYPVAAAGSDVLWLPGLRRADLGWVSEATTRYLSLRIVEEGAWKSERF